jgi:pre-mRNA-splicing factor ATP-dependent RNA helicase DHX16
MKVNHSDDDISEAEKERRRDQAEKDAEKSKKILEDRSSAKEGSIMAQ